MTAKQPRTRAPRDQRYDSTYLFGAVRTARGIGAALVLPYADAEAMNLHLAKISRCVAPARKGGGDTRRCRLA